MRQARHKAGFTLLEATIVVVVISLIIGAILVAQNIIKAGEMQKIISQQTGFDHAVSLFQSKYSCLPGDCANASDYNVGFDGEAFDYGGNGNGDGRIAGHSTSVLGEFFNFWYHLSRANLIAWSTRTPEGTAVDGSTIACYYGLNNTPYGNIPHSSPCLAVPNTHSSGFKGGWWVVYSRDLNFDDNFITYVPQRAHYWWITAMVASGGSSGAAVLIPADAFAIDSKLDDGLPLTGNVLAVSSDTEDPYGPLEPQVAASGRCVRNNVTPSVYNTEDFSRTNNNLCSLLIRSGF